jgi:hypothetical protein
MQQKPSMARHLRPGELQMDKQGALINLSLMFVGVVLVAAKYWHEPLCLYVVVLMSLVAALQQVAASISSTEHHALWPYSRCSWR